MHDLREIVDAILYVNRTGIAWEYLPHDFPPYKTVHSYFTRWAADGTTETIHGLLRGKVRRAVGRDTEPTAAIIDSQSVKTSSNVPESSQGIDASRDVSRCPSGGPSNAPTAGSCSTVDSSVTTKHHQNTPVPTSTGP
ncbi:transposase [Micromonospora sp. NPDC050200]|uniref:transposase n=1 Tax=Micromonospora sp. NPDC050200 TaxID=3155664 RepID=UPI0033D7A034